ncbi:MAG: DUF3313 family protein [Vitreimonas sp.]
MKHLLGAALAAIVLGGPAAYAENPPAEWDGLVRVQSRHFDAVYLAPGADFSGYTKVMLDPTEVAFKRNWQRDFNNSEPGLSGRISDQEARDILAAAQAGFQDVFRQVYAQRGIQVVDRPGPDVLRLRTAVANLDVVAPDRMIPGRTATFSDEAGEATVVIEIRDSMSGAILGRGVDRRAAGDNSVVLRRSSVTNRADFERTFRGWAEYSADALARLRSTPAPAAAAGQP